MKEEMSVEGFHQRCAELLCAEHVYKKFPYKYGTRWNNRTPGNGRYVGKGMVRCFGSKVHVSLRAPIQTNRWFNSKEEALAFFEDLAKGEVNP